MEKHIVDYVQLSGILPEMSIWDQIILLMDPPTMNNFLHTFPILKLLGDYTHDPQLVGTFWVKNKISVDCGKIQYALKKDKFFVYRADKTIKPFSLLITESHFLIKGNKLYFVDNGIDNKIGCFFLDNASFSPTLFINSIKKYHEMSETFYMYLDEIRVVVYERTHKKIDADKFVNLMQKIIPAYIPRNKYCRSKILTQLMKMVSE